MADSKYIRDELKEMAKIAIASRTEVHLGHPPGAQWRHLIMYLQMFTGWPEDMIEKRIYEFAKDD